jgi:hypothetical protein
MLSGAGEVVVVSLSTRGSVAAFALVSVSARVLAFALASPSIRVSASGRASPFAARAALTTGGDRPSSAGWHSALPLLHRRRSGGRHRPCSTGHRRAGMHLPLDGGDPVAVPSCTAGARPCMARRMIRPTDRLLTPSMAPPRFDDAPSSRHSSGRPTGVAWLDALGEALTVAPVFPPRPT